MWCLSNDIAQWSQKLRVRHGLCRYFDGFVISGEIGSRKPDAAIFQELLRRARCLAEDCVFVDDRVQNLEGARRLGFKTFGFGALPAETLSHRWVAGFDGLAEYLV